MNAHLVVLIACVGIVAVALVAIFAGADIAALIGGIISGIITAVATKLIPGGGNANPTPTTEDHDGQQP